MILIARRPLGNGWQGAKFSIPMASSACTRWNVTSCPCASRRSGVKWNSATSRPLRQFPVRTSGQIGGPFLFGPFLDQNNQVTIVFDAKRHDFMITTSKILVFSVASPWDFLDAGAGWGGHAVDLAVFVSGGRAQKKKAKKTTNSDRFILWYIMVYYDTLWLFILHYVLFPTCQVRVSGSSQRCNSFSPPAYCSASSGCSWAHLDPKTCQIECQIDRMSESMSE